MSERTKMLAGDLYNPSDDELVQMRLNSRLTTEKLNQTSIADLEVRTDLLKSLFGSSGKKYILSLCFSVITALIYT